MLEMINYPAIYIANGTALLLLLIILLSSKRPRRYGLLDDKMYHAMVILNIVQCVTETVTFLIHMILTLILDIHYLCSLKNYPVIVIFTENNVC